jgi:Skp family chaperone for outer membrane proteins
MKTFNTVVSIVLLVTVGYLLVKEFSSNTADKLAAGASEVADALKSDKFSQARIAYVNSDSLAKNYDYREELKVQLETKAKKMEADLAFRSNGFQESLAILQQQAANLTQQQLQEADFELQQKRQELQEYAESKQRELALEERKLDSLLMVDMDLVLEEVKQEFELDYVFSYSRQSSLLTADDAFDITPLVVERLNAMHQKKKDQEGNKK